MKAKQFILQFTKKEEENTTVLMARGRKQKTTFNLCIMPLMAPC